MVIVRRLSTDEDAPRAARELLAAAAAELDGSADHRRDDLALVVSEMVSNAVLHGPPGAIDLRVVATPSMVRIEVRDGGTGFTDSDGSCPTGHWGLGLIREFSDRFAIEHRPRTCVWCEFDLSGRSSASG